MARQWSLTGQESFEKSLRWEQNVKIPAASELKPNEVLVKLYAASLNPREIAIASPDSIGPIPNPPVIPGCDGAGIVEAVGSAVTEFRTGDRVATHLGVKTHGDDDSQFDIGDVTVMLGQGVDGTLRTHGVFLERSLVLAPKSLEWIPAATLSCTWVTAWNVLFGLEGKAVTPDSWVLVQGTGGVSVATLQLAVAAGASVVATTSSEEKAARLKGLGAKHVVNYRANAENWNSLARDLTPGKRGFDIVIDVAGNESLNQSLSTVRNDGLLYVVGGVGAATAPPVPLFAILFNTCIVRGILGGSRNHFKELVKFIDEKGIKPVVDDVAFELADAKDAYRRLKEKKHFAKVVIRIDH